MGTHADRLLSVPEVARLRGVTERTVWNDIRTGRLVVVRDGRRVLVSAAITRHYRPPSSDRLLTVDEVASGLQVSVRTVRRWISEGALPVVRESARRLRIPANAPTRLLKEDDGSYSADPLSAWLWRPEDSRRATAARRRRELRTASRDARRVADGILLWLTASDPPLLFSVRSVAALARVSPRTVYHHIRSKGAPATVAASGTTRVGVTPLDAMRYAGEDSIDLIVAWALRVWGDHESQEFLSKVRMFLTHSLTEMR